MKKNKDKKITEKVKKPINPEHPSYRHQGNAKPAHMAMRKYG